MAADKLGEGIIPYGGCVNSHQALADLWTVVGPLYQVPNTAQQNKSWPLVGKLYGGEICTNRVSARSVDTSVHIECL